MQRGEIKIPAIYDPIIFCGVLREKLSEWTFEGVNREKDRNKGGRLKNGTIEHRILEVQNFSKNFDDEKKATLFSFEFHIKRNSLKIFASGPPIFLNLSGVPKVRFTHFTDKPYFPQGVLKKASLKEIARNAGFESDSNEKITSEQIFDLEEQFQASIELWVKAPQHFGKKKKIKGYFYSQLHKSNEYYEKDLYFHHDKSTDTCYLVNDVKKYFSGLIRCKNWNHGCRVTFEDKIQKVNHEKNCTTETRINVVQKQLGFNSEVFDKARKFKLLPEHIEPNRSFVFFDIEAVLPKSTQQFGKSCVQSVHKLCSIAVNSYINGEHNSKVWTVKDNSQESEIEIVKKFLTFCEVEYQRVKFCSKLKESFKILCEKSKNLQNGLKDPIFDMDEISTLKTYVESQLDLSIFGYNSSRYDLAVMFSRICQVLDSINFDRSDISMIKKANSYFSLKLKKLHFKDLINFSSPMKLERYLQIWGAGAYKLIYPYELFSCIEEIRACKSFPEISEFKTALNPSIDCNLYAECKKLFEYRMNLPEGNRDKWYSFEDYLKFYNVSDVEPVSKALLKQFATYEENFGTYPMTSLGLPSYAKNVMYNMYCSESPSIFTFSEKEATNTFRNQVIGGLTAVYKRHVTLMDEDVPFAAKFNKQGKNSS